MRRLLALCAALLASVAAAQGNVGTQHGTAAVLRALDTISGKVEDIELAVGETTVFERLMISLRDCRYPQGNVEGEAFAFLSIRDVREERARFAGWMMASSPALNALEHPRYDVWVLRCKRAGE